MEDLVRRAEDVEGAGREALGAAFGVAVCGWASESVGAVQEKREKMRNGQERAGDVERPAEREPEERDVGRGTFELSRTGPKDKGHQLALAPCVPLRSNPQLTPYRQTACPTGKTALSPRAINMYVLKRRNCGVCARGETTVAVVAGCDGPCQRRFLACEPEVTVANLPRSCRSSRCRGCGGGCRLSHTKRSVSLVRCAGRVRARVAQAKP